MSETEQKNGLPYRRVLGTLSHIVSMIDHGSVRIARAAAIEMIEEIRRVQDKPTSRAECCRNGCDEKPVMCASHFEEAMRPSETQHRLYS